MDFGQWKRVVNISWKEEGTITPLLIDEFNAKKQQLMRTLLPALSSALRADWRKDCYKLDYKGYWGHIYSREKGKLYHYICNLFDDEVNQRAKSTQRLERVGTKCNQIEQSLFKDLNGVSQRQAFGYSEPYLNVCVPKQLYYINDIWLNKKMSCVSSADYSSHYPASMCGAVPTWDGHVQKTGTVAPTEEYPFAFYLLSGHSAQLDVYDTHEWLDEPICDCLFGSNYTAIDPDDDITILCKKSDYTYDSLVDLLYSKKCADELIEGIPAKTILNASIGYKHLRSDTNRVNRLYHIAAVAIARANQKMIDLYNMYSRDILQIVVDSVIYMGNYAIGTNEKKLGNLRQECVGQRFIMRGINQYIFQSKADGSCLKVAHSGFNSNLLTSSLDDISKWERVL